jgi:hypothetical protein
MENYASPLLVDYKYDQELDSALLDKIISKSWQLSSRSCKMYQAAVQDGLLR